MKVEVRLAGSGGQGLILAGIILAEGCGVYEKKYVVQTQSYGPEARGGSSRSDVIISDREILFPKARRVDLLACLSQAAYCDYLSSLKEEGILLLDDFYVRESSSPSALLLPFSRLAREQLGRELFANIILLGTIAKILERRYGFCHLDSLKKALAKRVPKDYLSQNLSALELGYHLQKELTDG
ncbi:MAG: 2-oxoacid:acceptor oxidoreductase family protein [candidate division WOR-3 bacterium]